MGINVGEKSFEEIEARMSKMRTPLTKIAYLESALKQGRFMFETKRAISKRLAELYADEKMYEKAAKTLAAMALIEITFREKIEDYLQAGEMYARVGKIEDAEEMFTRAVRDATPDQKPKILLARKNVYLSSAQNLDKQGKTGGSVKFYEKLVNMKLDSLEKQQVKKRLLEVYKSLGKFKEAELLEGLK